LCSDYSEPGDKHITRILSHYLESRATPGISASNNNNNNNNMVVWLGYLIDAKMRNVFAVTAIERILTIILFLQTYTDSIKFSFLPASLSPLLSDFVLTLE
jgi:hypothetical protein